MKRILPKAVSLVLIGVLCLTQVLCAGAVSVTTQTPPEDYEVLAVITDAEDLSANSERHGIGRSNVSQSSDYAHSDTYSMKYEVADGQSSSMWNNRKRPLDLFALAPSMDEIAVSFWVYTEDATTEAELLFKLRDNDSNGVYMRGLKKTEMAPTAGEWHRVILPLKEAERSANFDWRDVSVWALEGSAGTAFTLWVDDIELVSYPADAYPSEYTLASGDTASGIGLTNVTTDTDTVHDGTGSFKLSVADKDDDNGSAGDNADNTTNSVVASIGLVSYRESVLTAIEAAEAVYDTLTDEEKATVDAARTEYDRLAILVRDIQKVVDMDLSSFSNDNSTKQVITSTDSVYPGTHLVITPTTTKWSIWYNDNCAIDISDYDFDNLFFAMDVKRTGGNDGQIKFTLKNESGQAMTQGCWYNPYGLTSGEWGFAYKYFTEMQNPSGWSLWTSETWDMDAVINSVAVRQDSSPAETIEIASMGIYDSSIDKVTPVTQANAVVDAIAAIASATDTTAITAARTAYNALSDAAKALVVNYEALTALETAVSNNGVSMWCTDGVLADWSTLETSMDDLALSFWVYAESVADTDADINFGITLASNEANWDNYKLTYYITKQQMAPTAGEWYRVVIPLSEFSNTGAKGDFDWTQVKRWKISQQDSSPAYTMCLDQLELVSLVSPASGMSFVAGEVKVELTNPFASSIATVEARIVVDDATPDDEVVGVILGNTDATPTPGDGTVRLWIDTYGNPLLLWNGGEATIRFNADVRTGESLHLAVVRDSAAGEFRLYIDGELADTQKAESTDAVSDTVYIIGGDHRSYVESTFEGWIGDVRVWSSVHTAQEIDDNLYTELTGEETGLIGNWLLGEDVKVDTVAADVSVNQNDGIVSLKPIWIEADNTEGDFTLVALPDTQYVIRDHPELYPQIFQWIADNVESENIQYVLSLGDIVDNGSIAAEWNVATAGFELIDGKVPYTLIPGNHDYNNWTDYRALSNYNKNFPAEDYADMETLQGYYEEGCMENTYHCFSVQGINYMILALEFMPRDSVLEWACDVVEAHPDHNVIVTTHAYLTGSGERELTEDIPSGYGMVKEDGNAGEDIWYKLVSRYSNIFLVLCGHVQSDTYHDVKQLVSVGENGNTVYQIMSNAQFLDEELKDTEMKSAGMLLMMRFTNYGKTINFDFYSPIHDMSYREENCFSITIPDGQLQYVGVTGVEDGATYDLGNGAPTVRFDTGTVTLGGQELSSGYKFTQAGSYTLNIDMYGEKSTITFTVTGTLDTEAPVIAGVGDGGVYYTTQTITVTDAELDSITVNGEAVADVTAAITLDGNPAQTTEYVITATDKVGNSTTVTVTMKPIADISSSIAGITTENVKTTDAQAIQSVVTQLDELLQTESLTDADKTALEDAKKAAEALLKKIDEIVATPEYILGDINGDNNINASDALMTLQHSVRLNILEGNDFDAANVDGNQVVDATDALYILQHSVKLIDKFPAEK